MTSLLIKNIKELLQTSTESPLLKRGSDLSILPKIENGYLYIEDGLISDFGEMSAILEGYEHSADRVIDATGKMVMPTYCDSHTHIVYAGSREKEFVDKIRGYSYQDIAKRGGGILNSAELLHNTSEGELYRQSLERAKEIISFGTGAVEIKSGYGLSLEDELKMLRVIKRIDENTPLTVKATFLGAHALPLRYKGDREGYINEIINCMIPIIATEDLAEYIDIFCEDGFFTVEDSDRLFSAAIKYGLRPKVHANQMSVSGGVQVGVKYNARSVDHLEFTGEAEFKSLASSDTIATLLPGATFFMEMDYAPAREMINHNLPIALATNYNPGSCPCGDMKFILALASLKMKLTPEEVLNAATINGAYAMDVDDVLGSITKGKKANVIITKEIPSIDFIPYAFSTPLIDSIILNGKIYEE